MTDFTVVTSLVDAPGSPPPVVWRMALSAEHNNRDRALFTPGLSDSARADLQRRLEGGLLSMRPSAEAFEDAVEDACTRRVIAQPDEPLGATSPSNSLALVAGLAAEINPDLAEAAATQLYCGSVAADGTVLPPHNPIQLALQAKSLNRPLIVEHGAAGICAAVYPHVRGVVDCWQLYKLLSGDPLWPQGWAEPRRLNRCSLNPSVDLADVVGQENAKRALEIAVAGGHHTLFIGSPGGGKTLLASCIGGICPPLAEDEALEVAQIHQASGFLAADELPATRPVRFVGGDITKQALLGGGSDDVYYGEVSLASRGWLFADEALQLPRSTLEAFRMSLQDRQVHISRAAWKVTMPAHYSLICASNPCPCAHWSEDHPERCTCTPAARRRYQGKMSGALMDRLQLVVRFDDQDPRDILKAGNAERSETVRERVWSAVETQVARQGKINTELGAGDIPQMREAMDVEALVELIDERMSMRFVTNVMKVARTIADLDGAAVVSGVHLEEAARFSNKSW